MIWISLKTKVPKIGIKVLVTDGDDIFLGELTSMGMAVHGNIGIEVTHWMPLPELPFLQ